MSKKIIRGFSQMEIKDRERLAAPGPRCFEVYCATRKNILVPAAVVE